MKWSRKEVSSPEPTPSSLTRNISSPSKKYRAKPLTKAEVTSNESLFYWRRQYDDMIHYIRESGITPEEADDDEVGSSEMGRGRNGREGDGLVPKRTERGEGRLPVCLQASKQ